MTPQEEYNKYMREYMYKRRTGREWQPTGRRWNRKDKEIYTDHCPPLTHEQKKVRNRIIYELELQNEYELIKKIKNMK